jgi:hypothetical protein
VTNETSAAAAPTDGSWLGRGGMLRHQSLTSPGGRCTLVHELTGDLVLYDNARDERLWSAPAANSFYAALGLDGELRLWGAYRAARWAAGVAGADRLAVGDDGAAVLTGADGTVLWTTGSQVSGSAPAGAGWRPGRGSVLAPGEALRRQSLASADGGTVLVHTDQSLQLRDGRDGMTWSVAWRSTPSWLTLTDDGMLQVRDAAGDVLRELAGPGAELVVRTGRLELRAADGSVVWSGPSQPGRPMPAPTQQQLAAWIDSLAIGRGYCLTVVADLGPEQALARLGLAGAALRRGTWAELRAGRPDGAVTVAAVGLGADTLLLADSRAAGVPPPALSAGTTAVSSCHHAGTPDIDPDAENDFVIQRDGEIVAELRERPPRRLGAKVAPLAPGLAALGSYHAVHTAEWEDLALLSQAAGVTLTAAALGGEWLGGELAAPAVAALAPEPVTAAAGPPRPAVDLDGYDEFDALIVRTDYTSDEAWRQVVAALEEPHTVDLSCHYVDDPAWAGAGYAEVLAALPEGAPQAVFLADAQAMDGEHPLLAVNTELYYDSTDDDYEPEDGMTLRFRLLPSAIGEVQANLAIANMDFEEFDSAAAAEPDRVFRGYL